MKSNQVTIKTLADRLGISASTVSRALSDHPDTSAKTKIIVNQLAKELGYRPNAIALSLRNQRTKTIGVIIPEVVHFFFSTIISGIERVAYEAGYTVMICQSNESQEKEVIDTNALLSHRIDGLLVAHSDQTDNFDHFQEVLDNNIPVVFFDRAPEGLKADFVIIDDFESGKMATEHLIDQGCQRIAHLTGPQNIQTGIQRQKGYEAALEKHGFTVNHEYIRKGGLGGVKGGWEEGYEGMKELLSLEDIPDGVFANNDMSAYGAITAIKEVGLKVPDDIAVIGFSNWRFSDLMEPKLSTISQPGMAIGQASVKKLLEMLDGDNSNHTPTTTIIPTELIVRASSKKLGEPV